MEEMLRKFYAEYETRYTRQVNAGNMLDTAMKYPELFGKDSIERWNASHIRHCAEVRELRKVAKMFGIPAKNLEDIENSVIDSLC